MSSSANDAVCATSTDIEVTFRNYGSADLTSQARKIMEKIADKGVGETGTVTVSGHTDNVPLMFGGNFRENRQVLP